MQVKRASIAEYPTNPEHIHFKFKACPLCANEEITTQEMAFLGNGIACVYAICSHCGASAPIRTWQCRQGNLAKESRSEWRNGDKAMLGDSEVLVIGYHPEHPAIVVEGGNGLDIVGICNLKKLRSEV
ncbi:hypothetical protein [Vibrio harveyi]|uniref:hypothetical protein n=1 Tax=Vibrio harveyi TaxID=669 RepID=UPI000346EBF0|nr:hypothetical protein [Vibrio harveyi]GEA22287.1 hypothetical protein VH1807_contig00024-0005 [Vibrio harveyi]